MPVASGIEATARIRDHERANGLPACFISACTAFASDEDKAECLKARTLCDKNPRGRPLGSHEAVVATPDINSLYTAAVGDGSFHLEASIAGRGPRGAGQVPESQGWVSRGHPQGTRVDPEGVEARARAHASRMSLGMGGHRRARLRPSRRLKACAAL